MKYIKDDRTRKISTNVYVKLRELKAKGVQDDRLDRASKLYGRFRSLMRKDNPPLERVEEILIEARDLLNRVMTKEFGSASLNKVCDWK